MIDFLKGLFFVRKCLVCSAVLPDAEKDTAFCPKCLLEYEKLGRTICKKCGKQEKDCACMPDSLKGKISFSAHLFAYESALSKTVIFALKRQNLSTLQNFLVSQLANRLFSYDLSDYTVTYAPRKPKSVREYGFDQAEILAQGIAKTLELPFEDIFSHAHFSKLQKELNAKERAENAEKSYKLRRDVIPETKGLLIVDDVMTTGSTMAALISLAKEAGYEKVAVVCVAKTVGWALPVPAKENFL
ncbi:MAG: ComF family protein [Clostridia bacterium]|nr:ComF family protein [Clostridia bacterium]